jgi:hypothetical protein
VVRADRNHIVEELDDTPSSWPWAYTHNGKQQHVVVGGNAGGGLINDGLASGSSLPGSRPGRLSRGEGNGDRGTWLERIWSCAARSSWLGPNGLSGAGHKRRRHAGANDIEKARTAAAERE